VMVAMLAIASPAPDAFADAAEVETQSAQAVYNQGTQALDRSEWDAAADAFERVVALKDSRAEEIVRAVQAAHVAVTVPGAAGQAESDEVRF